MKKRKQSQETMPSVDFLETATTTCNNLETKIVPSSFSMN
jgi:hypothetical protein